MFILLTPQINYLSAFHLVCVFMGLISKVYFVKFDVHFILCVCVCLMFFMIWCTGERERIISGAFALAVSD